MQHPKFADHRIAYIDFDNVIYIERNGSNVYIRFNEPFVQAPAISGQYTQRSKYDISPILYVLRISCNDFYESPSTYNRPWS